MLRTVVLPPHPQPLSQRARGARKTFKVPRPQGEGFRERETPGFELDKVYLTKMSRSGQVETLLTPWSGVARKALKALVFKEVMARMVVSSTV
jgi:hypothetical protein